MIVFELITADVIMTKTYTGLSFILIFSLAVCGAALAQDKQMYSWTDDDGVVHFTDQKPAGMAVEVIEIPDTGTPTGSNPYQLPDTSDEPSAAQKRRDEIAQNRQERAAEQERKDRECADMREEVANLEPHRRVFFTNADGETERMGDTSPRAIDVRFIISVSGAISDLGDLLPELASRLSVFPLRL